MSDLAFTPSQVKVTRGYPFRHMLEHVLDSVFFYFLIKSLKRGNCTFKSGGWNWNMPRGGCCFWFHINTVWYSSANSWNYFSPSFLDKQVKHLKIFTINLKNNWTQCKINLLMASSHSERVRDGDQQSNCLFLCFKAKWHVLLMWHQEFRSPTKSFMTKLLVWQNWEINNERP